MATHSFDSEVTALLELLEMVIRASDQKKVKLTREVNPILKYLKKYVTVYNLEPRDLSIHEDYFLAIYRKHRRNIQSGPTHDEWLRDGNVVIQFGSELTGKDRDKVKNIKVMLSTIYNTALKLQSDTETELDGLPEDQYSGHPELDYPESILLHLYRIFSKLAPSDDIKILTPHLRSLENELNVSPSGNPTNNLAGGLSGITSVLATLASSMGVQIPSDQIPSENDLNNFMMTTMQNPQVKNAVSNLGVDLNGCNDISEMGSRLLQGLQTTPMGQNLMSSLMGTMAGVVGDGPVETPEPIEDLSEAVAVPND